MPQIARSQPNPLVPSRTGPKPAPRAASGLSTLKLGADTLSLTGSGGPARIAPDGRIDFYLARAADFMRRHPGRPAPDYYLNYGDKYVRRFSNELSPKLSPAGQQWLAQARINLQVALENQRARDPIAFDRLEQNNKALTKFAYQSHPKAYLDAGLANLPLKDLIQIGMTPDVRDLFNVAGLEQVVETAAGVARQRVMHLLTRIPLSQLGAHLDGVSLGDLTRLGLLPFGDSARVA